MIDRNFLKRIAEKYEKMEKSRLKDIIMDLNNDYINLITVFNSMIEGVIVLDQEHNILFYNKMASGLLGIQFEIGMNLHKIKQTNLFFQFILSNIAKQERLINHDYKYDTGDKYLRLNISPLVKQHAVIGNIILFMDVTDIKQDELKLKQAESLTALTTLVAGVAHEIKNPLAAIDIHLQLINKEMTDCEFKKKDQISHFISILQEEVERLNKIVVDFLFSIRPLKTKLVLKNLQEIMDIFIEFIKPELEKKNIAIIRQYDKVSNVYIDENYFKQALLNIVQNASSAMSDGGKLTIRIFEENENVNIGISDTGPGIPDENIHKIFEPYFTTKDFGTGLGLTIVYKIVKEHGGKIDVRSNTMGTTFTISLPQPYKVKTLISYNGEENAKES